METVFINTENSRTNEPHKFRLTLADKLNLKDPNKNEFDLPDGSYSISDIQDYFEYIIKKHETIAKNLLVQIYGNKIKIRTVFKIKTSYNLQLLSLEKMRLLGSTRKMLIKIKMEKMCQNKNR